MPLSKRFFIIETVPFWLRNSYTLSEYPLIPASYYDAKMAEGRTHYNALGHCAGKLVRILWKMMTDDVEFNLD